MKKALFLLLIFCFTLGIFVPVLAKSDSYDHQVKRLYSDPDGTSNVVYIIPIEVKMLDVSEDANWYKVGIQFNMGPICFKYSGWAYIPIGQILAERYEKARIAATSKL